MIDNQLINGLQNGDEESFRLLVKQYQRQVINICYRFVHDRAEAEDLAQETFMEVHRSIRSFRGQASLSTWIYRIAASKSLVFLRKYRRQKRMSSAELVSLDDSAMEIPAPASHTPEAQFEQQERVQVLQEALDSLPKSQQVAFVLSKYDGMNYQEIAALLNTTLPSVESLIHRAKNNLQKKLCKYYKKHL